MHHCDDLIAQEGGGEARAEGSSPVPKKGAKGERDVVTHPEPTLFLGPAYSGGDGRSIDRAREREMSASKDDLCHFVAAWRKKTEPR